MRQLIIMFVAVLLLAASQPSRAQDPAFNLLQNPGFENAATRVIALDPDSNDAQAQFAAPPGWGAYIEPRGEFFWQNALPAGRAYSGRFTVEGTYAFQMGRAGAIFTASLLQRVENIPAGVPVVAGAQVYMQRDDPGAKARVGIAPDGGLNPNAPNVVWSEFVTQRSMWHPVEVSATAAGNAVTIFLNATQDTRSHTNNTYWDAAYLAVGVNPVEQAPAPAGPVPSGVIDVVVPFQNVNVRSGPGITFDSFALATPDSALPLTGQDGAWYQVNYFGRVGYISVDFARVEQRPFSAPVAAPPPDNVGPPPVPAGNDTAPGLRPPTGVRLVASQGDIALLSGPSDEFPDIATLPQGAIGEIVGRTEFGWLLVQFGEFSGWSNGVGGQIDGDLGVVPLVACC